MIRSLLVSLVLCAAALGGHAQSYPPPENDSGTDIQGPVRLRSAPPSSVTEDTEDRRRTDDEEWKADDQDVEGSRSTRRPTVGNERQTDRAVRGTESERRPSMGERRQVRRPSEFETFVQRSTGQRDIRRFGSELMLDPEGNVPGASPLVPADYLLNPGDELLISLWGTVDGELRTLIDRSGRVNIPRVGPVMLAGVRFADAPDVVRKRVAQVFRNFDVSVSLARLRGIRVFVTGFVDKPGSYTVSSLSTVLQGLLRAGGPSSAGSFRQVELRRTGQSPVLYDLYDLLLKGDRSTDRVLQAGDVIHVGPVGRQVAVVGSVNRPAIFELKDGENTGDALQMAGGYTAVADRTRLSVERLAERTTVRIAELRMPQSAQTPLGSGDVLRAFSAVQVALPEEGQAKRVRVEGEVQRPGEYILPPGSSVNDALAIAGGLTPNAFVYGTEFTRESVRKRQQENYERAIRDLEVEFTKSATTQRTSTADEAAAQNARASNTTRLIEQLRALRPTGRIVFQLPPDANVLPDLALQDGDRISVPSKPTTIGVFGSVYNGGSFLFSPGRPLASYLQMAGGPTSGADAGSTFVIRANGSVVSSRQNRGWFGVGGGVDNVAAEPGDTIFVPEEFNKTTFIQNAKDWTQILYQFGLGVAAIQTLRN